MRYVTGKNIYVNKVASIATHKVFAGYNIFKDNKYINLSVNVEVHYGKPHTKVCGKHFEHPKVQNKPQGLFDYDCVGCAPVVSMATHRSQKPGLRGLSGSNPDWGAPAFIFGRQYLRGMII